MTKITNSQIEKAQKVADLMLTLNKVGHGTLGNTLEKAEGFIKEVNRIDEEKGIKVRDGKGKLVVTLNAEAGINFYGNLNSQDGVLVDNNSHKESIKVLEKELNKNMDAKSIYEFSYLDKMANITHYSELLSYVKSLEYSINLLKTQ